MDTPSDTLLAKYLSGQCSATEARSVEQWSEADAAHRARLDCARAIWVARRPPKAWDVEGMWQRVRRAMAAERHRPAFGRHLGRERERYGLTIGLAAAAVLVLIAGASLAVIRVKARTPSMREYATARGQRADMRLADGTHIVLSVDSKLLVPADFGATTRDVYLHGEAYFDVVHDQAKPFAVHLDNTTVRDVGTRFGVRAYAGERRVQVVVAEGRVAVQDTELGAGQLARLDSAGALSVARHVDMSRYLGWTEGRLALYDTPLADALPDLARWYDLDITLAEATLGQRRFTFEARGEPLAQVLDGIALLVHARYERHGRSVTFHLTEDVR